MRETYWKISSDCDKINLAEFSRERRSDLLEWQDLAQLPVSIFKDYVTDAQDAEKPFIWTEVFLREINRSNQEIILHIWPMTKTVILGMLDRELPHLELAKKEIISRGYEPVVRNFGGLAVVADEGILNFSLVIPDVFERKLSISDGYLIMVDFIRSIFSDFYQPIEHFEVETSYCPGKFDLSINGKKFAGLAQRRIKNGIAVSIYLSVCGDQKGRSQMISDFYKIGLGDTGSPIAYPNVDPEIMANLSDLLDCPMTVEDVIDRMLISLKQVGFNDRLLMIRPDLVAEFDRFQAKSMANKGMVSRDE
ncbi:hypothetical protein HMPREF1884_01762 [Streptococcus agalactiae]|nr:hypothetical protein HMPREF1884_01762 [Streptococcus agalactiae]